jgi:hypothetical protein
MGQRDTSHGKNYISSMLDGNKKSHVGRVGRVGHGKHESDASWFFQLMIFIKLVYGCFTLEFDFFSDEHPSIISSFVVS